MANLLAATSKSNRPWHHLFLVIFLRMTFAPVLSAPSGNVCVVVNRGMPGSIDFSQPTIAVFPTGTSATMSVKASDFLINLLQNSVPDPNLFTGFQIIFGGSVNINRIRMLQNPGSTLVSSPEVVLDANVYKDFWISWTGGLIAFGTGLVPGRNMLLNHFDWSSKQVYYLRPGNLVNKTVSITYCYNQYHFDQMLPSDTPASVSLVKTALDCGRACVEDPGCQGFAVRRNWIPSIGNPTCSIFYSIARLQFDTGYVTYVVRNATYQN